MTRELRWSNGCQAFAAGATAAGEGGASAAGGLAGEKPVLAFAADLGRLILAFHKILNALVPAQKPERERIAIGRT
jgi:hypothetical protein